LTDEGIIELYLQRSENAIKETSLQYNAYCTAIAMNILHNKEDAEESVNDTYLKVWNSIPPQIPTKFSTFIGRITRNISLNKYEINNAKKRGGSETAVLLSELENCIASADSVEDDFDKSFLDETINDFILTLKKEDMAYFICRYWYLDSVLQIMNKFKVSEGKVTMSLHRSRKKLKVYLEKKGFHI